MIKLDIDKVYSEGLMSLGLLGLNAGAAGLGGFMSVTFNGPNLPVVGRVPVDLVAGVVLTTVGIVSETMGYGAPFSRDGLPNKTMCGVKAVGQGFLSSAASSWGHSIAVKRMTAGQRALL